MSAEFRNWVIVNLLCHDFKTTTVANTHLE